MNGFNYLLYQFLKVITKIVLRIYYPKTTIINRENLKFSAPTIIACSHPNTMMDPLHVASRTRKPVYFLANADLFATRFGNWFYSNFFCIPIKRKMDDRTDHISNKKSFERVIEFLTNSGCLWIAPEGGSYWGRHWLKLKTGTARMALLTEAENNFELGLRILPIGLNYEAPNYFGTNIVINVGEPIEVKTYKAVYEDHFRRAVTKVTDDLEEALQALEISPDNEEEDSLHQKVERMIQNELPASTKAGFYRSKGLLKKMQEDERTTLKTQIDDYFTSLKEKKLSDRSVMQFGNFSSMRKFFEFIWVILGFPLFIYGSVNNLLPSFLPYYITNSRQPYIGYRATVKMVIGLFTFPIVYTAQGMLIHHLFQNGWITLVYILSLIPAGLYAWRYANYIRLFSQRLKIKRYDYTVQKQLVADRKVIMDQLLEMS